MSDDDLKQDVFATKADLHRELHAQTRKFATWIGLMTAIILGGVYFFVNNSLIEIRNDIREIRVHLGVKQ